MKGSAYGTFSRAFAEYVIRDTQARDLLKWMEHVYSPDEYYWSTLHYSGRVPGGYTGETIGPLYTTVAGCLEDIQVRQLVHSTLQWQGAWRIYR